MKKIIWKRKKVNGTLISYRAQHFPVDLEMALIKAIIYSLDLKCSSGSVDFWWLLNSLRLKLISERNKSGQAIIFLDFFKEIKLSINNVSAELSNNNKIIFFLIANPIPEYYFIEF